MATTRIVVSQLVQFVLIKMGAGMPTPTSGIRYLTDAEAAAEDQRKQAEVDQVMATFGDHTGAVTEGVWDDGIKVYDGPMFTFGLVSQLEALGLTFFDVYLRDEPVKSGKYAGSKRPVTYVVFARDRQPLDRATAEAKQAMVEKLDNTAWAFTKEWNNSKRPERSLTFNLYGTTPSAPGVELVAETAVSAEAPQA